MKIKMIKHPQKVVDVSDKEGKKMIKKGRAVSAEPKKKPKKDK